MKVTALKRLNMLNERAVKNLKKPNETLNSTFKRLKFYSINSLYKLETIKFIKLFKEGKLPQEFDKLAESINHHQHTRNAIGLLTYQLPHVRTDLGKSSIKFKGIQMWNDLPEEIKLLHGETFKK